MGSRDSSALERKKSRSFDLLSFVIVRKMGLEPTREYTHKILSLARLPIPTLPLTVSAMLSHVSSTRHTITQLAQFVNTFLRFFYKKYFSINSKNSVDKFVPLYYNSSCQWNIDGLQKWRNWQTRTVQVRMVAILCGFKSHLLHDEERLRNQLLFFVSVACPVIFLPIAATLQYLYQKIHLFVSILSI